MGSSSLREELFNTFLKAHGSSTPTSTGNDNLKVGNDANLIQEDKVEVARRRKEKAVREREERVKAERSRVEAEIGRSRVGLNQEEGERSFRCVHSYT